MEQNLIKCRLEVFCFAFVALLSANASAEPTSGTAARLFDYSRRNVDVKVEAKRLSLSSVASDRSTAAGLVEMYPTEFDASTAVKVLNRLLGDKSDMVKRDSLGAIWTLANLPPNLDIGKADVLRVFMPAVERLANSKQQSMRVAAVDALIAMRRRTIVNGRGK